MVYDFKKIQHLFQQTTHIFGEKKSLYIKIRSSTTNVENRHKKLEGVTQLLSSYKQSSSLQFIVPTLLLHLDVLYIIVSIGHLGPLESGVFHLGERTGTGIDGG